MISVVIVVYKSKKNLLKTFIKKLDKTNRLIIINNSKNYDFSKIKLPKKTTIIKMNNNGYGSALNLALKHCKTKYAIISNIDVSFKKNFFKTFYNFSKKFKNLTILIPNHKNQKLSRDFVETYDGEAATMMVNVKKILDLKFDENYFLYYEETDLFHRCKLKNYKVFKISDLKINHKRSSSVHFKENKDHIMKWHYMWSMFYYYKKNFDFFYALKKTYILIVKDIIMLIYYLLIFDNINFKFRFYRLYGILCSILGFKSFKRP